MYIWLLLIFIYFRQVLIQSFCLQEVMLSILSLKLKIIYLIRLKLNDEKCFVYLFIIIYFFFDKLTMFLSWDLIIQLKTRSKNLLWRVQLIIYMQFFRLIINTFRAFINYHSLLHLFVNYRYKYNPLKAYQIITNGNILGINQFL